MNPLADPAARLVIAHRGAGVEAPENTLPAFARALERGAHALELDVHLAADGEVVVIHDPTVDRTTDRTGPVAGFTAAELGAMDAGHRWTRDGRTFPFRGRGIGIPTLAQVLRAFPDVPLLIEVKTGAVQEALARVLLALGAEGRVVVAGEGHDWFGRFRSAPFIAGASAKDILRLVLAPVLGPPRPPGYRMLSVPLRHRGLVIPTAGFVRRAHRLGAAVSVWTVDDAREATRLWRRGVNGIVTNDPAAMVAALRALDG